MNRLKEFMSTKSAPQQIREAIIWTGKRKKHTPEALERKQIKL